MEHSEKIGELAKALAMAQGGFKPVKRDATNPFYHSKYAPLSSIIDATREALTKNGLAFLQTVSVNDHVTVETMLMHESGEWVKGAISLKPKADDPQAAGSAITYGRRYSLGAILGVASEDDDDGNSASKPKSEPKAEPKAEPQTEQSKPAAQPSRKPQVSNPDDTITQPQQRAIHALLTKLKIEDDMARMEHVSRILALDHTITSVATLTKGEASTVIEQLGKEMDL
jgi:hypothetical protein